MTRAIRIHEIGGPEVLRWEAVEVPAPGPGEVLLRQTAVGLNFLDTYYRSGLYALPGLPSGLGSEAAGVVEAMGPGVADLEPGQRVAYAGGPLGAYAERRTMPADRLVPLPDDLPDEQAAAAMLQGMTARYLLRQTYRVRSGDTILVHAAAGGVGLLACQWAAHLGATVIGTVGSEEKARLARDHGCTWPIPYEGFAARVREITGGRGVPVVYDGVGRATFDESLDCLAPLGLMVYYGNASGAVPPVDLLKLSAKGSLFVTRPTLFTYTARREDLLANAEELFEVLRSGAVRVRIGQRFPLAEAARAHEALEGRRTTGSTILLP